MVNKKNIAIIQARLGSSRLENKIFLKFRNETSLSFLINRISKSKLIDEIVVAIPKNKKNLKLKNYIKKKGYKFFEGKENDVLNRYYKTAKKFKADNIIRITADCPFHDSNLIDHAIKIFNEKKIDFLSNYNPPTFPDGFDLSIMSFNALKKANKFARTSYDREHVVPYILKSKKFKKFNILNTHTDEKNIRLTLDYLSDYLNFKKILEKNPILVREFSWKKLKLLLKN